MSKAILIKPVVTEKSINHTREKWFMFEVGKTASKHQIKHEVENLFSVNVLSVRTINRYGKTKRVGKARREIKTSNKRFALIKIGKDQTIDLFTISPDQTK